MSERIAVPAFDRTLMTVRVFWDDARQGWFWCETNGEGGEHIGDMVGPFESALEAGKHARKAVINRADPLSSPSTNPLEKQL